MREFQKQKHHLHFESLLRLSRLAANTLGFAFAVVVSVVARYIQHDFLLGQSLRITKNPGKKNSLLKSVLNHSNPLQNSPALLKNLEHLVKLFSVARYIRHRKRAANSLSELKGPV